MTTTALTGLAAIDVADIKPSPNNPREHLDGIDELAASIRETGLIQPVVVQHIPGHADYTIVAGHRRHAAIRALGWAKVPCIIRKDMLPDEELIAMLVENGQRANLDPIEEARAVKRLKDGGLPNKEIARKLGRTNWWVQNRLMLLRLPLAEQEQLRQGNYSISDAMAALTAQRQAKRKREGVPTMGRPKGATTKPWFSDAHPLAKAVRTLCDHRGRVKVGGVGCGPCWEQTIRTAGETTQAVAS